MSTENLLLQQFAVEGRRNVMKSVIQQTFNPIICWIDAIEWFFRFPLFKFLLMGGLFFMGFGFGKIIIKKYFTMRRGSQYNLRGRESFDEAEEGHDVVVEIPREQEWPSVKTIVQSAAEYTWPAEKIGIFTFFMFLTIGALIHETHFTATVVGLGIWFLIQSSSQFFSDDFDLTTGFFWIIMHLLQKIAVYLFIGLVWSSGKLYYDIYHEYLPVGEMETLSRCFAVNATETCDPVAWDILKQMDTQLFLTWPVSLASAIARNPLVFFTDLLYEWSKRRYVWIIQAALSKNHASLNIKWWLLYLLAYCLIGFIWTHAKLFIDVWQKALPRSLEAELKEAFETKNYWSFIRRIKWTVMMWAIIWPLSLVFTLLRHPLRIVTEFIYELNQKKYIAITDKAMQLREKKEE